MEMRSGHCAVVVVLSSPINTASRPEPRETKPFTVTLLQELMSSVSVSSILVMPSAVISWQGIEYSEYCESYQDVSKQASALFVHESPLTRRSWLLIANSPFASKFAMLMLTIEVWTELARRNPLRSPLLRVT